MERQPVSQCGGGDERIASTRRWLAARRPQLAGHPAERPGCRGVKRKWLEVGFRLLEMGESSRALLFGRGQERPHGQLSQGDGRDERLMRQGSGIQLPQVHHRGGVQDPALRADRHRRGSSTASISARRAVASMRGTRRRREMSCSAVAARRGSGTIAATGSPSGSLRPPPGPGRRRSRCAIAAPSPSSWTECITRDTPSGG